MPETIGRYQIVGPLGRGGMATVLKGFDPRFNREVAIKVLPRQFLHDENTRMRFQREAEAIARLEHASIVPVYDVDTSDDRPYLVMRLMAGGSLADRLKLGRMTLDETINIMERIASGLDAAHQQGMIHRDLKPANILFDQYDNAYLSDFGIVKLQEQTAELTQEGGVLGTPLYMAPEMLQPDSTSPLIDIYAMGVMVYYMLSGEPPYQGETPTAILMAHATAPIPDVRINAPDLPPSVQQVIEKAMAKEPMYRYQTAGEMVSALKQAQRFPSPEQLTPSTVQLPFDSSHTPQVARVQQPAGETRSGGGGLPVIAAIAGFGALGIAALIGIGVGILILTGAFEPEGTSASIDAGVPAQDEPTPFGEEAPAEGEPLSSDVDETGVQTGQTTPTEEAPAPTSMPDSVLDRAYTGVTRNADWEPIIREFDGVPMALVPAGCFQMGWSGPDAEADATPVHEQCFDVPFWVDVYEVSVGQYRPVNDPNEDRLPQQEVDWFQAGAHCAERGGRLLTEREWEYAARGPESFTYPWGDLFVEDAANYCDTACFTAEDDVELYDGFSERAPIGSFPEGVSWVGAYDMVGNIYEWTSSLTLDYPYDPNDGREVDGRVEPDAERVYRGGGYAASDSRNRTERRSFLAPNQAFRGIGLRCGRDFSEADLQ